MSAPNACLNCGAQLTGEYCGSCGQRKVVGQGDLTLREFLEDTTQELAHWEGKVPQSLKTLFLKPGQLTLDFLAGRRARWLPSLRIYLICSVAYFLSVAFAAGVLRHVHVASFETRLWRLLAENDSQVGSGGQRISCGRFRCEHPRAGRRPHVDLSWPNRCKT